MARKKPAAASLPKLIRVTDPNADGSVGVYDPDAFQAWVHEVHLEGHKRDVAVPSFKKAIKIVKEAGCTVELDPETTRVAITLELVGSADDAVTVIGKLLDGGLLQEAINEHEYEAGHLRVLSASVRREPTVETLTPNPKWYELCGCGAPNHACSCGDNEDLYTCDYCDVTHLIYDTTPTDKDCHACPGCFKALNLREWTEWIDERGAQWRDPVTGEWSSKRPYDKRGL